MLGDKRLSAVLAIANTTSPNLQYMQENVLLVRRPSQ